MSLSGFPGNNAFNNSKVAIKKVISDTPGNAQSLVKWGNSSKGNVGLKSHTKGITDPTTGTGHTSGPKGMNELTGAQGN